MNNTSPTGKYDYTHKLDSTNGFPPNFKLNFNFNNLEFITVEDVINYYGLEKILNHIGEEKINNFLSNKPN